MSATTTKAGWDKVIRVAEYNFDYNNSAMIVIDLQYNTASRDCGSFKRLAEEGHSDCEYAISRIESVVVPNVRRLAEAMRAKGRPVFFFRVASIRGDGSDQTERHRRQGLVCSVESREAQILEELDVQPEDTVLTKSGSGCFTSTNLDHMLHNMKIQDIILTGMWTNSCVETTARHAGDLDYRAIIPEDCCVAFNQDLHDHALTYLDNNFAMVRSTDAVLAALEENTPATRSAAAV